jgi:hypothetical protein
MSPTRLFIECPNCHQKYLVKYGLFKYGNGAYIEKVAGAPEFRRLLCPCRPNQPYNFQLAEKTRVHLVSDEDSERTRFLPNNPKPRRGRNTVRPRFHRDLIGGGVCIHATQSIFGKRLNPLG